MLYITECRNGRRFRKMGFRDLWRDMGGENLRESQKTAFFCKSNMTNGKISPILKLRKDLTFFFPLRSP